jgi:adenylate cyclase
MIFVSYHHSDRERVRRLVDAFEAAGIDVWWDQELVGGTRFTAEIERNLQAADLVVACWGVEAASSDWVRDEADYARTESKLFSVTLGEKVRVPLGFRGLHTIKWDGGEASLELLVRRVCTRLEHPMPDAPLERQPQREPESPSRPAG